MVSTLGKLELHLIDPLSRQQLLDAVRLRRDYLPADLLVGLEEQGTDQLRLLLLTSRLIEVLRELRGRAWFRNLKRD
jgi:hypothetical protein